MNKKELLLISIGIFLTVICWLIADVYHASTYGKTQYSVGTVPKSYDYQIDKEIFNKLLEKRE